MPLTIKLQRELDKLPRVTGPSGSPESMYVTPRFNKLIANAEDEAKKLKDEYVSVEHLLLAATDDGGPAGKALKEFGVTSRTACSLR